MHAHESCMRASTFSPVSCICVCGTALLIGAMDSMAHELAVHACCSHANVVRLLGAGLAAPYPFLVLERMHTSLKSVMYPDTPDHDSNDDDDGDEDGTERFTTTGSWLSLPLLPQLDVSHTRMRACMHARMLLWGLGHAIMHAYIDTWNAT